MTRDEIRGLLHAYDLDHLADEMLRLSLPAIRIEAHEMTDDALPIGASKFGGLPDVPGSFHWPVWRDRPLAFLAQFHLPDLVPYDVEHVLPPTGTLSFFYEADTQPWGYEPSDRGSWRVDFTEADVPLHRAPPSTDFPFPRDSRIAPHSLTFFSFTAVPTDERDVHQFNLSDEEFDRFLDLERAANGTFPHQLLGHPDRIQGDMQLSCHTASQGLGWEEVWTQSGELREVGRLAEQEAYAAWRLLLQIDSLTNSNGWTTDWGMSGLIYFWIRRDHLAARDFSNVWLKLQCT